MLTYRIQVGIENTAKGYYQHDNTELIFLGAFLMSSCLFPQQINSETENFNYRVNNLPYLQQFEDNFRMFILFITSIVNNFDFLLNLDLSELRQSQGSRQAAVLLKRCCYIYIWCQENYFYLTNISHAIETCVSCFQR